MRVSHLFGRSTAPELAALILTLAVSTAEAIQFNSVPSPNIDISRLGRVALTGDFDSISLYTYEGQTQNVSSINGGQSLLMQRPDGAFATLLPSDGSIVAMCPFIRKSGELAGIVIGGNFTSLDSTEAQGAALWDPNTNSVTALTGLNGSVNALYCDQDTDTVYVGGDFKGLNSSNAITWYAMDGWANTPFQGFNGPVNTITKAPDGQIVFGGSFTGLANTTTPQQKDQQIINLSTANISNSSSASTNGFSDPKNIVCKTSGEDGAGNTWLLPDNVPGFWKADLNFGFQPTKLRLYNTQQDGRGTKTFRFTAFPINGIMNLTYTDPDSNQNFSCDATCPLRATTDPQEFGFVNPVGMNSFQIDISEWYGSGGGLNGIEVFQNDIYAYAVPSINEPNCTSNPFLSSSTVTGPWDTTESGESAAQYLTANLTGPNVDSSSASVTFFPDIKQSGNYTVTLYTPGCQQDSSCDSRGIANITSVFQSSGDVVQQNIYQTNDFEKYDQIYRDFVDAGSDSFRPSVTLSPKSDQNDSISLVALRVRFELLDASSNGLNGLFEFDSNQAIVDTDFSKSKIATIGTQLNTGADITSLAIVGENLYVAGNFTADQISNILVVENGNMSALPNGGLNDAVTTTFVYGDLLFVGGNFTNTNSSNQDGLEHVAIFDAANSQWSPMGGGVDGPVTNIVPIILNVTQNVPESCITVNGPFGKVLASGGNEEFDVDGLAIWVPSRSQWINGQDLQTQAVNGKLSVATNITDSPALLAGTVSPGLSYSDAVALSADSGAPRISSIGLSTVPTSGSSSQRKRDITNQNFTGVSTGLFVTDNGRNISVLAGRFAATASDGSTINNLAFISTAGDGNQTVTGLSSGLDEDSYFMSLTRNDNTLYAGGLIRGRINDDDIGGIIVWDLGSSSFASTQLPAVNGAITAISVKPSSTDVYIAGTFDGAGGLGCQGVCFYSGGQWNIPGRTFSGNVSAITWQGNDQLLVGGQLRVEGNQTSLAIYDAAQQSWSIPAGADIVPGPVNALSPASSDGSSYWIAGNAAEDGSSFLIKYDGSSFKLVARNLGERTTVRGLSVFSLTQNHGESDLLPANMALLITGSLNITDFGNASAALFNGTDYTPFILSNSQNGPGSLGQVVTEQKHSFDPEENRLRLAYVILIALAIALGIIFLLIALGLFIERRRRRAEGYRPAPQNYFEKTANMGRIPPEHLFGNLSTTAGPKV